MPNLPVGGLAQAFLDPFNTPIAEDLPPELPEEPEDPVLAIILADPDIDPVAKAIFKSDDRQKRRLKQTEQKLLALQAAEEAPGVISWLGPVPVGLQVGTYLGIKNPVLRFATDIVVDPLTFVSGVGLGVKGAQGFTKIGRATKYLAGMSAADKLEAIGQGAKLLGRTMLDEKLADDLAEAALKKDYKAIAKAVKETKKFQFTDEALDGLGQIDENLAKLLRGDKTELQGLKDAMEVGDRIKNTRMQESFFGRVLAGQAAFLNFGIPFTDVELGGLRLPNLLSALGVTTTRTFGDVSNVQKAAVTAIGEVAGRLTPLESTRRATAARLGVATKTAGKALPAVNLLGDLTTTTLKGLAGGMDIRDAMRLPSPLPDAIKVLEEGHKALEESAQASLKQITGVFDIPEQEAMGAVLGLVREVEHKSGLDPRDLEKFIPRAMQINESQKVEGISRYLAKYLGRDTATVVKAFRDDPTSLKAFKDLVNANLANQATMGLIDHLHTAEAIAKEMAPQIDTLTTQVIKAYDRLPGTDAAGYADATKHLAKLLSAFEVRVGEIGRPLMHKFFKGKAQRMSSADFAEEIHRIVRENAKTALAERESLVENILQKQFKAPPLALSETGAAGTRAGPGAMTPGLPGGAGTITGARGIAQALAAASTNPSTGANVLELEKSVAHARDLADGTYMTKAYGVARFGATGKDIGHVAQNYLHAMSQTGTDIKNRLQLIFGADPTVDEFMATLREHQQVVNAGLHPAHLATMEAVGRFFDNFFAAATRGGILTEEDYIRGYVPHSIDWKDPKLRDLFYQTALPDIVKRIGTAHPKPGFAKPRVFDTMEELDAFLQKYPTAFKWRSKKLSDIVEGYAHGMGTAIVRNQFLDFLDSAKTASNAPMLLQKGPAEGSVRSMGTLLTRQTLKRGGVLPGGGHIDDYMDIDNPALKRFYFHKEVGPYIKAMFERDILRDAAGGRTGKEALSFAWDVIRGKTDLNTMEKLGVLGNILNDIGKSPIFRLAPFHMTNLHLGTYGLLPGKTATAVNFQVASAVRPGAFLPGRGGAQEITQSAMDLLSRGVSQPDLGGKVLDGSDLVRRAVFSGVHLGRGDLGAIDYFQSFLKWAAEAAPRPLKSPLTGLSHINETFDKNLWEVTQNGHKIITWAQLRLAHIKKDPSLLTNPEKLFKVENELANLVNTGYGGLGWERMLVTPNARTVMRMALIAPDWTISNLLFGRDMFLNIPGVKEGALGKVLRTQDVLLPDLRFRAALQYNLRLGLYTFLGANMMNYLFSGKFLWESDAAAYDKDTGLPRIELPYTDHKGRKQYMDTTKQFVEPWQWMRDPLGSYSRKMGVLPHIFKSLVVGTDSFGNPIAGTGDGPYVELIKRIGDSTGQFLPISGRAAFQVAAGNRDPRSAAISSLGFPVRSEAPGFQKQRQTMETLEAEVAMLKAQGVR